MRAFAAAALAVAALAQPQTRYALTSAVGPRFHGVGGISGGGATSRLLFSYAQPQLGEILDYLFKPQFGASLHYLKVEIGGDGQSTEGTEPSHQHDGVEAPNYARGYEWRLMVEAKARNPAIKLGCLPWVWPGWVGVDNVRSPWSHPTVSAGYVVNWLRGARDAYNLTIDFVGINNERGWNATYVKVLRAAMDAAGFGASSIVCGDGVHVFECAAAVAADPELRAAVVALGAHQPQAYDPVAASSGLPMWSTEAHFNVPDGSDSAFLAHQLFIDKNVTGYQWWALVAAYDDDLAFPDHGLLRAYWPRARGGHYELIGRTWTTAHTTQFTDAASGDWHHLANGTGAAYLRGGGTYVGFVNARTGAWTLVIEKQRSDPGRPTAENATFVVDAALAAAAAAAGGLRVWHSVVRPGAPANDTSAYFKRGAPLVLGADRAFTLPLAVGDVFTLTTLDGGAKGAVPAPPPPPGPFPTAWADDFEGCAPSQEAEYWTDQNGAWECVPDSATPPTRGTVMRQMSAQHPIAWRPDESRPHTVLGSMRWRDVDAAIDFRLAAAGDAHLFAVRCAIDGTASGSVPISSEDAMAGVWLQVDAAAGAWRVYAFVANVTVPGAAVATGALPAAIAPGAWHTVRLTVAGATAAAALDGASLFAELDVGWAPRTGWVGVGTADWGQHVEVDRVVVTASY